MKLKIRKMEVYNINKVGFGKRLLAFIIDMIICSIIGALLSIFTGNMLLEFFFETSQVNETAAAIESLGAGAQGELVNTIFSAASAIGLVGFLILILEGFTGQTPAKMLLGIKIANQDGTNANTNILFLRTFLKNISSVLSLVAIILAIPIVKTIGSFFGFIIFIGCFFALGSSKQSIHDMISKTAVFKIADLKE